MKNIGKCPICGRITPDNQHCRFCLCDLLFSVKTGTAEKIFKTGNFYRKKQILK